VYVNGEESTDTWAEAAAINPDPSSLHGVYAPWETSHKLRKWQIEEAGHYGLTAEHRLEEMTLHVYDPSGMTKPIASGAGTAPTCPALPCEFEEPGLDLVDLEKRTRGIESDDSAGDVLLRVSHEKRRAHLSWKGASSGSALHLVGIKEVRALPRVVLRSRVWRLPHPQSFGLECLSMEACRGVNGSPDTGGAECRYCVACGARGWHCDAR
jgi:hypothetical protein